MPEIAEWLASGAVLTVFASVLGMFFRSAVSAHKQRADEWYELYKLERKISVESTKQVTTVVSKVEKAVEEAQT